jgi:uncharacterized membrane protein YbaN (DUF454 family)
MKILFIALGFITLGLGVVGMALPILPTTPFLLASAFCFAKSSERLNTWFKGTKLYQDNLRSFVRGRGMTRKAKLRTILTITAVMAVAFIAMRNTLIGRVCLAVVWVAHLLAFLFLVKTCPEEAAGKEYSHDD